MKIIKNKFVYKIILILILMPLLSGCSLFERDRGRANSYSVKVIKNIEDMEDSTYYVKKSDKEYHQLFIGNNNFKSKTATSAKPERVAWFGKDIDQVPTMHKGESLVFYSENEFKEGITVERFNDTGFTIGIAGLQKTDTGRFSFSTKPSKYDIDINASTGQMYELGEKTAILDSIGNAKLRQGNVSESGTVMGLEEGKTYSTYVYIGTQAHHYNFVADVRALVSSELTTLWDFDYDKNHLLEFTFPDYFNSGYYFIGGYGIVKYINGPEKWNEKMDMNIPNDYNQDQNKEDHGDKPKNDVSQEIDEQSITRETVTAEDSGTYNVEVKFEKIKGMPDPTAKLVGPNGATTLKPAGDGKLAIQIELEAGKYELQIIGLEDRPSSYGFAYADTTKEKKDSENKESDSKNTDDTTSDEPTQKEKKEETSGETSADKIKKALENN